MIASVKLEYRNIVRMHCTITFDLYDTTYGGGGDRISFLATLPLWYMHGYYNGAAIAYDACGW